MGEEKEKMKEKEINTDTDFEKPELTEFGKFCQKHGINSNLIMLKITLFVMYGGKYIKHRHCYSHSDQLASLNIHFIEIL